jgi:hypothetical protein
MSNSGFRCVCGQTFDEERGWAIRHVEEVHAGEFDTRDIEAVESAIRERITPPPID